MWGVRLFDEAKTAAERRTFRVARRRRQREVARIGLLREYFADAIHEVDPGFFHRLEESKYYLEDRDDDKSLHFLVTKTSPIKNTMRSIQQSFICEKSSLNHRIRMMFALYILQS